MATFNTVSIAVGRICGQKLYGCISYMYIFAIWFKISFISRIQIMDERGFKITVSHLRPKSVYMIVHVRNLGCLDHGWWVTSFAVKSLSWSCINSAKAVFSMFSPWIRDCNMLLDHRFWWIFGRNFMKSCFAWLKCSILRGVGWGCQMGVRDHG